MKQQPQTKSDLEILRTALESGTMQQVERMVSTLHPAEVALLLESLPPPERNIVWGVVNPEDEGEVLVQLNDEVRTRLIEGMPLDELVTATEGMELDDLADVIANLPETITQQVIRSLSQQDRERLHDVLAYPEDSAGGLMNPNTVSVRPDLTLKVVLRYLRMLGEVPDNTDALFVVGRQNRYVGVLLISRLVTQGPGKTVAEVMDDSVEPIHASTPAAEVAKEFQNRDLIAAAVVDENGRLLGQITVDDVVDVIREQADHDILSMAGLDEDDDMFAPVVTSARRRAIWLGVNLATAFVAAAVVGLFKPTLDKVVILAVLMPVVASMGGVAGSQTLTLMIRGLALGRVESSNARWIFAKELAVGLLNGLAWAAVVAVVTRLFFDTWAVGAIIAAALAINLLVAAVAGFAIPLLLRKAKIDPALAGGVVLTTVTDVVGFVAFLGLGTIYLT
ncbi:MAG: magnesium transporter [Pseudomonadota bacterium]|nr:magnesium transporter [Pseudomonadota bacterium]